jgi:hypothetical protein
MIPNWNEFKWDSAARSDDHHYWRSIASAKGSAINYEIVYLELGSILYFSVAYSLQDGRVMSWRNDSQEDALENLRDLHAMRVSGEISY